MSDTMAVTCHFILCCSKSAQMHTHTHTLKHINKTNAKNTMAVTCHFVLYNLAAAWNLLPHVSPTLIWWVVGTVEQVVAVEGTAQAVYHWQELPQVSFLLRQVLLRQTCVSWQNVFVMTKHVFCGDKTVVVTNLFLWWQTFVVTNTSLLQQNTKIFCHDKHNFVATKVLSRQAYFFRDKNYTCASSHQW